MTDPHPLLPHLAPHLTQKSRDEIREDLANLQKEARAHAGNWFQRFLHRPWSNPWRIFARDFRSITSNVMGLLVTIGLVIVPCLYAWFNIAGCWNVYANTGNLSVAVANTDQGYTSDLIPMKVSIGNELVSQLRANKQLGWTFVSEKDAVDGVKSGKYYASIIIPKSFSADMMTLFSKDIHHASLIYYTNNKENPLAPTVTGKGASAIKSQVNSVFASTITNVGLGVADTLGRFMNSPNAQSAVARLSSNLEDISRQTRSAGTLAGSYRSIVDSSAQLLDTSSSILPKDSSLASTTKKATGTIRSTAQSAKKTADSLANALDDAIGSGQQAFSSVASSVDRLYSQSASTADSAASSLATAADQTDRLASRYSDLAGAAKSFSDQIGADISAIDQLEDGLASQPSDSAATLRSKALRRRALERVRRTLVTLQQQADTLQQRAQDSHDALSRTAGTFRSSAQDIRDHRATLESSRSKISGQISSTAAALANLKESSAGSLNSQLTKLASSLSASAQSAVTIAGTVDSTIADISSLTGTTHRQFASASRSLGKIQSQLTKGADQLDSLHDRFEQALKSKDVATLKSLMRESPSDLASIVAAPISVKRHAVYAVKYFGEQMTPFYAILALWVGSTLLAASSKSSVSHVKRRGLIRLRQHHLYFGRYLSVLLIALIQATVLGLGCLFFLKVQSVEPWLFMATCWIAALVFSNFIYTMGYVFGVIGKAICVFFMIVQISGSSGMYPVQMMPHFFVAVRPWLPATYAMNALRESIAGVYGNEWMNDILHLLIFMVPMLLIGLLLYKPLRGVFRGFERQTADSNLMGIS